MRIEIIVSPYLSENCYLLIPKNSSQVLVVDPGVLTAGPVKERLKQEKLQVGAVLCTHGHPDHIWDAAEIAGDKPVYVPAPDLYRFENPMAGIGREVSAPKAALSEWQKPVGLTALEGEIISQGKELISGAYTRMIPAPGHTEGSALFLFATENLTGGVGKNILEIMGAQATNEKLWALSGDVIFNGSVGRTDLPGGDPKMMLHTLRTVQNVIDPRTVLLPGHGPATILSQEKRLNPFMIQARFQG